MKILYVEDSPHDADLATRHLLKAAPHVRLETVATVGEASARLERLDAEPLDLVLTDVRLPDGDGLALLTQIRDRALALAVVVITGTGDEETAVAALKAGADDYVTKRKDYLDRLPLILESALHHYRASAVRRSRPLRVLYAEHDPKDVEFTRRHFGKHAGHIHIDVVSTGPEALQRLQATGGDNGYDVLLLDYRLPGLDALELLKELRLIHKLDIPVVLVTGQGSEEVALQAIKLGASSYVVKNPGYLYKLSVELENAHVHSELTRREEALRESEERNSAVLRAIPDLMFLQSRNGVYLDYHAKDAGSLLVPPEQFLGRRMEDVLPAELAAALHQCFERALETGETQVHEYSLTLSEESRWYEARIAPCNGKKLLSVVRDITERKRAEDALKENENQVRLFVEHTPVAVAMFDREMRYMLTSRRWLKDNSLGEQEIIGRSHYEVVPDIPGRWREGHRRCMAGAVESCDEDIFLHPDGTLDWVRWEIRPWYAAGGEIGGIIMFSEMITERKQAAEALRASEDRFVKAFNSNPQPMWLTTLDDGRYIDVNESFLDMSGYTRHEVVGRTSLELNVWETPADRAAFVRRLRKQGSIHNAEEKFRTKGGAVRVLLSSAELMYIGEQQCILVASSDITERKRAEEELLQLTVRLFNLQDEERRRIARELHDGTAQNLFAITFNLARLQQHVAAQDAELQQLIADTITLGDESLREIRTLSYLLHPPLLDQAGLVSALRWYVEGFIKRSGIYVDLISLQPIGRLPSEAETALFRIVQESLTNIRRHSGGSTASVRLEKRNGEIVLQVKDDGHGMPPTDSPNPADDVQGLGVGIPGMRQRMRQLGGRLEVASGEEGTTVTAVMPFEEGDDRDSHPAG